MNEQRQMAEELKESMLRFYEAQHAVLLANGFDPDKYSVELDGKILAVEGNILANSGNEAMVKRQLDTADEIERVDLEIHNKVAEALLPKNNSLTLNF